MTPQAIDMSNTRVGRFHVTGRAFEPASRGGARWWLFCTCKAEFWVGGNRLRTLIRLGREPVCRECGE